MSLKTKWEILVYVVVCALVAITGELVSYWAAIPIVIANVFGYAEGRLKPFTKQPKPQVSEGQFLQFAAECRDALQAGLPYMEGASFTSAYARAQVKRQIEACQAAIAAMQAADTSVNE